MVNKHHKKILVFVILLDFLFVSPNLFTQTNNDIVFSKKINNPIFEESKVSYCKEKTNPALLTWSENFEKPNLSKSDWTYAKGNSFIYKGNLVSGWGNNELQYYRIGRGKLNTNQNLFIEDGLLKIQPIFHKNKYKKYQFTSARIHSKNKKSFTYPSKITFCFKVPSGIGFWPAFWLMPDKEINWPKGGEIDIMENRGRISNVSSSALHFGFTPNNKATLIGEVLIPQKVKFQDHFHSITLEWLENEINFYLNDETEPYFSVNSDMESFKEFGYPFNSSYHLIINVAAGGIYDDYWVDKSAFCNDKNCSNQAYPNKKRFLIDWIEYQKLN